MYNFKSQRMIPNPKDEDEIRVHKKNYYTKDVNNIAQIQKDWGAIDPQ